MGSCHGNRALVLFAAWLCTAANVGEARADELATHELAGTGSPAPEIGLKQPEPIGWGAAPDMRRAEPGATYAVQLGSFEEAGEAVERAKAFPGARIDVSETEEGRSRYRVLWGEFASVADAERAILSEDIRSRVPDAWVNPEQHRTWVPGEGVLREPGQDGEVAVVVDAQGTPAVPPAPRELTQFPIDVTLNCSDEGKEYRTRVVLDSRQSAGEMELMFRWACQPPPEKTVARPSAFQLSPAFGFVTSESDVASAFRSAHGVDVKAYHRVGAWGPEFRYRLLRTAEMREGSLVKPPYTIRHEIQTGARFFFKGGWELAPAFGFSTTEFTVPGVGGGEAFISYLLPVFGLSVSKRLVGFEKGTQIWMGAGYEQRFAFRDEERSIYSGNRWHAELLLRSGLTDGLGAEGFLRYEALTQEASDISQSDSIFIFGFSLSFGGY